MAQEPQAEVASHRTSEDEHSSGKSLLGPLLCWAVVFADIGTSIYYVPGILYNTEGITTLAGFFVFLTMSVFVLLTLKYAEVTQRFPQGGGVVTVAAQAINHWFGALGGMFILVDYFLTAAISCLSGMIYLSVVLPAINPLVLEIAITVLILLGILNWFGISESAKVSLVGAIIAFVSDLAILVTVFTHISFSEFIALIPQMFANHSLGPANILIGFAASFLAFSGLESISQLSPVMKTPRKKVAGLALLFVVLTIGITSPLLTMLSTMLLPAQTLTDPTLSGQVISLLAGHWSNIVLQTEVAISASALLVFASNTAIIGSYHVFMALSRMDFFPAFVLKRNKLRGTPHYSIALSTSIPIIVLIIANGSINFLGELYAFGLLGAFTLTCLGLDIIRHRERKAARTLAAQLSDHTGDNNDNKQLPSDDVLYPISETNHERALNNGPAFTGGLDVETVAMLASPVQNWRTRIREIWYNIDFWLGILTTILVATAWTTNLIVKHFATVFGITVAGIGMLVAYINYRQQKQKGYLPVVTTGLEGRLPGSILAVLTAKNGHNDMIMRSAINSAEGKPVVFLYLGEPRAERIPQIFEVYDPYLYDPHAKKTFGKAENLAQKSKSPRRFVYSTEEPGSVADVWHIAHPHDTIVAADYAGDVADVNPDRIRYELTPQGKVAHLIKSW
ncbi:MAG TPA: APC family permease [Ktedonobacteraceae bacterium]|nr:APC family permease [Ktedonobacteraceae bacterium]